jgi:hypothetical protein
MYTFAMYCLERFSNKATIHVEAENCPAVSSEHDNADLFLLQVALYYSQLYCMMSK